MNEEAAAAQYLLDRLEADTTMARLVNGVWLKSVPQNERMPAVKIDALDREDLMVIGLHRVWNDLAFLVRGVDHWRGSGQPDWSTVREIGDRIDSLLHDHEGQNGEIAVHSFREESFTDETVEGGDLFLAAGGIYRVRARALNPA